MLDTVVISGEDVCCSVVFGTLVGVSEFSVMWSELLMTSSISCPGWSSVYDCHNVECVFTFPVRIECGMFVMCINGRRYACCGECYVVSDECDEPTSCLVQPIVAHC